MTRSIQLLAPNHSLEQRVNDYMRPFHTATCQEHLIGALQQLPRSPTFPREESSIREQVALRLLQEVIVMGAQEQEALDACLVACGPLEALSACATTLQEIAARNKSKKKKKNSSPVESPSILETSLRTIRRWLVKGVSFPPEFDPSNSYEDRCWVEQVTAALSNHATTHYNNFTKSQSNSTPNTQTQMDIHSPLVQACLESLTKLVLMFPVQIANACHALAVQLPTWAIASRYNPRLIEGAISMGLYQQEIQEESSSYSVSYFKVLVQHMVRSRNPDDVALGLYKYHERHYRSDNSGNNPPSQPKALCHLLLQLHRQTLSPRESSYLLRSIMISSIPRQSHATKIATTQLTELWQRHLYPYMELSCRPILVASRRVREAFVRLLILSPSSVLAEEWPDRLLCHCVASLLANPVPILSKKSDSKTRSTTNSDSSDDSSSTDSSEDSSSDESSSDSDSGEDDEHIEALQHHAWLAKHMQEVIATWSLAVFVRQTDHRLQRHVTNFLLSGMCFLQLQDTEGNDWGGTETKDSPPMSELVAGLLEGVTVRLESSIHAIRKDGMMIAERLAQKMGQELQFDELEQERSLADDDDEATFLQSVMTASEFPSHYRSSRKPAQPPPRPPPPKPQKPKRPLLQQRREEQLKQQQEHEQRTHLQQKRKEQQQQQQQQQQQKQQQSERQSKKKEKKKEKEERKKRRKAKREGKSDTRILDALYGQMKALSTPQSPTGGNGRGARDSYEDSCTEMYPDTSAQQEQHLPSTPQFQMPGKSQPRNQQKKQTQHPPQSPQSPSLAYHIASRVQGSPKKESEKTNDSYDNSTTQENDTYQGQSAVPIPHKQYRHVQQYEASNQHAFHQYGHPMQVQGFGPPQQLGAPHLGFQQSQFPLQRPMELQRQPQHSIPEDSEMQFHDQQMMIGFNGQVNQINHQGVVQKQHSASDFNSELATVHNQGRLASDHSSDPPMINQQGLSSELATIHQQSLEQNQRFSSDYSSQLHTLQHQGQLPRTVDFETQPDGAFFGGQEQVFQAQQQVIQTEHYPQQQDVMYIDGLEEVHVIEAAEGRPVEGGVQDDDNNTHHVTFDNHDYVIPELEQVKQENYWQKQKNQQRRQQHYKQQHAVELQLQKQQEHQQKEKEREQKATLAIATNGPPQTIPMPKPKSTMPRSPTAASPKPGKRSNAAKQKDRRQPKHHDSPLVVETVNGVEDQREGNNQGEDVDTGVAKCWTHKEVEMVLENNPPRHSPLSPLPHAQSPKHPMSPTKSPERQANARRTNSPRRSPVAERADAPSAVSERGGDVPSLIFAMVDDEDISAKGKAKVKAARKNSGRETPIKNIADDREKHTIDSVPMERVASNLPQAPIGKPPLSPRPRGQNQYNYRRQKREQQPSISSSETPNQKDSITTSVRSRRHPHVDPAVIDARILAAAYDHESVPSSDSAPSLSVYSSSSSQISPYLHDEQARNEASQRATRSPKQPYANAYQHMKKKHQQRRNYDDNTRRRSPILMEGRTPNAPNKRVLMVDPDAAYVSEDEEEYDDYDDEYYDDDEECTRSYDDDDEDYSDEGSYTEDEDEYDDDSVWDESEQHLDAYDLEDDEEDLLEVQQPRYLRDCLQLLRTEDSDSHAYSKQEAALKWLPQIVQGEERPADLSDLAVPLALELMRMENKYNMDNFEDDKLISVIALAVEEPLAVGQRLILLLWEDVAFMDRLDVLTVLSEAAFELSGNKELEEWQKQVTEKNAKQNEAKSHGKRVHVIDNYSLLSCKDNSTQAGTDMGSIVSVHAERALGQVEDKTRRWGRGRRQPDEVTFRSRFGPVAHVWYYSLVGGFMQRKDNAALWGGAVGARLLANMFVTLATIVECAGIAPGTDVLAKDLFELVWSFRTVDVAEVRMGVLVAVAAALSCLSEEVVLTMMFDGSMSSLPEGLKQMAQLDPDENCRRLAQSMSKGISGIVDSLQPVGKISKLSLAV